MDKQKWESATDLKQALYSLSLASCIGCVQKLCESLKILAQTMKTPLQAVILYDDINSMFTMLYFVTWPRKEFPR